MGAPKTANGKSMSILVVEDEEHIRQLMASVLERAGFNVLLASDGAKASEIWARDGDSITILVADIIVPDRTGSELAVEFRKTRPRLKVIFISGRNRKTLVETQHIVRGAKFLLKPYSARRLVELVHAELATESDEGSLKNSEPRTANYNSFQEATR